jgi:type I restriction enzyme S subunit
MANDWQTMPIGEVAIPAERSEKPIAGKSYRQIGVRLWGEGAYERESIDGGNTRYAFFSWVEEDDIIVNKIWARNGSVAVVPEKLAGCYVSTEFPIFAPMQDRLFPRWFHWLTKTRDFWNQCDEKSRGTSGKNRIRPEQFLKVEIPLPPLPEQQRIIARVDALARCVEEARGLRRASVKQADSLVESQFRSFLTQHSDKTEILPLDKLMTLQRRPVKVSPDGEYREIGIYSYGKGIFHKPARTGFEVGEKDLYLVKESDLILQITFAGEGAVAIAGREEDGMFASVRFPTFRVNEAICDARYLLMYLRTSEGVFQLGKISPGSAGRNKVLSLKRIGEVLIPVIPLNSQRWLMDKIDSRLKELRRLQAATQKELDALMPSILAKAFAGEL